MQKHEIFFSKQRVLSNLCALHAVNNLIGAQLFSQQTFDEICNILQKQTRSLGLEIRNRHIIGGDYDANVILKAVQNCGLITKWVDSRQNYQYKYEKGTILKGYIVNIKQKQNSIKKLLKFSDRHWICLKLNGLNWYLLDSKKQQPQQIIDIDFQINNLLKQGSQVIEIRFQVENDNHDEDLHKHVDTQATFSSKQMEEEQQIFYQIQQKIETVSNSQLQTSQYDQHEQQMNDKKISQSKTLNSSQKLTQ